MYTIQTMKIKLIKETTLNDQVIPAGHILEIEDEIGQALITSENAIPYTPDVEQAEEAQIIQEEVDALKSVEKTVKAQAKSIESYAIKGSKKMETNGVFGKAIKDAIETKAVTSFAGTEATPVLGQLFSGSKLLAKTNKQTIKGNLNVVFSGSLSGSGIGPSISIIGENTANAQTAPLMQYAAIPAKWFATVAIPNEYIDDVQGMEQYVSNVLKTEAGRVIDNSILNGAFTNNYGFKGVCGDANAVKTTFAAVTAVTKDEIESMIANVLPEAQDNAVWVVSPNAWSYCQAALLDADNVGGQLIKDGMDKSLYGYPVIVTTAAASANPMVFGDFSQYFTGFSRDLTVEVDRSAAFLTDATAVKVSVRGAGGLASSPKYYNNKAYGVITYAGLA